MLGGWVCRRQSNCDVLQHGHQPRKVLQALLNKKVKQKDRWQNNATWGAAESRHEEHPVTSFGWQLSTKALQEMLLNASQNIYVTTKNCLLPSQWPQVYVTCHFPILKPPYLSNAEVQALLFCPCCPFLVNLPACGPWQYQLTETFGNMLFSKKHSSSPPSIWTIICWLQENNRIYSFHASN